MENVDLEELTFWLQTTDEMDPENFFHAINELEKVQPEIDWFIRSMQGTIKPCVNLSNLSDLIVCTDRNVENGTNGNDENLRS